MKISIKKALVCCLLFAGATAMAQQPAIIPVPDQMKDALRARCMKNMLTAVARQNRAQPG